MTSHEWAVSDEGLGQLHADHLPDECWAPGSATDYRTPDHTWGSGDSFGSNIAKCVNAPTSDDADVPTYSFSPDSLLNTFQLDQGLLGLTDSFDFLLGGLTGPILVGCFIIWTWMKTGNVIFAGVIGALWIPIAVTLFPAQLVASAVALFAVLLGFAIWYGLVRGADWRR